MTPTRRTCPACSRRAQALVDPGCPVCSGLGVVSLGPRALTHHSPAAVSLAIEITLEDASRRVNAATGPADPRRRQTLASTMDELRMSGLVSDWLERPLPTNPVPDGDGSHTADALTLARMHGAEPERGDLQRLAADPTPYGHGDRPSERGHLPRRSSAGHPANLAQAADPFLPLDYDAQAIASGESSTWREAVQLSAAHVELTTKRNRP